MSIQRFNSVCDYCGSQYQQYEAFYSCRECSLDICHDCMVKDSEDEDGTCLCKPCFTELEIENKNKVPKA